MADPAGFPQLNEAIVRQHTTAQSYERGSDYYRTGAVLRLVRRGDSIEAEVAGSQYEPYQVRIDLDTGGIVRVDCDCPYDWGGWCKHIVAVLLACIHGPEQVEERAPMEELIAGLDAEQLQDLVLHLVEQEPYLVDRVEIYVQDLALDAAEEQAGPAAEPEIAAVAAPGAAAPSPHQAPVDTEAYRRQVRALLHSLDRMRPSEAYWHVGEVVGQVGRLLDRVDGFLQAGDGRSALSILEAITTGYMAGWEALDDSDGEASALFSELGSVWAEALLSTELSPEERALWADKLTAWQGEIDDYGLDEAFEVAIAAAVQGWDFPPLVRVLQGEITDQGAWDGEAPWYADSLASVRLSVLARQGRYQEYLYLAQAEGQMTSYLVMLARLGRIRQAVEEGLQFLGTAQDALTLAAALREQSHPAEALRLARHGLTLPGSKTSLANWLAEFAAGLGEIELALDAALISFREHPQLTAYLRVRDLAQDRWPEYKPDLLAHIADGAVLLSERLDVYLHEGMIEEAIRAVDAESYVYHSTLKPVVEAALESHPDWAIRQCLDQAASIIESGKSKYYPYAVDWLEKAAAAYRHAGREQEWRAYLQDLIARHRRKYSLVPMLESLQSR